MDGARGGVDEEERVYILFSGSRVQFIIRGGLIHGFN